MAVNSEKPLEAGSHSESPLCPRCKKPMEHGYVSAGNTIYWSPILSIMPTLHKGGEWLSAELFGPNRLVGWRCHPCRLVLVDYATIP